MGLTSGIVIGTVILSGTQVITLQYDDYLPEFALVGIEGSLVERVGAKIVQIEIHGFSDTDAMKPRLEAYRGNSQTLSIPSHISGYFFAYVPDVFILEDMRFEPIAGHGYTFYKWWLRGTISLTGGIGTGSPTGGGNAIGSPGATPVGGNSGATSLSGNTTGTQIIVSAVSGGLDATKMSGITYAQTLPFSVSIHPDYSTMLPIFASIHPDYGQTLPIFASIHPDYSRALPTFVTVHPTYSQTMNLQMSLHGNYVRIS